MTEIATIDWFWRRGTSVFSENTAILPFFWGGGAGVGGRQIPASSYDSSWCYSALSAAKVNI